MDCGHLILVHVSSVVLGVPREFRCVTSARRRLVMKSVFDPGRRYYWLMYTYCMVMFALFVGLVWCIVNDWCVISIRSVVGD